MKTVGQIIRTARQKRGLSLDHLSALTKIDTKYISALEEDRYRDLPSETFAKGFIRNLSQRLDLNPSELVAIFRRDFRQPTEVRPIQKPRHRKSFLPANFSQFVPYIAGALVFIIYLYFQFRAILTPPKLEIITPISGSVIVSPVEISGTTVLDAVIEINEEIRTRPDSMGNFQTKINLPIGENVIEIKSTNRFSRSTVKKIPLTIVSR